MISFLTVGIRRARRLTGSAIRAASVFAVLVTVFMPGALPAQDIPGLDSNALRSELRSRLGGDDTQQGPESDRQIFRVPERRMPLEPEEPTRIETLFSERAGAPLRQFGYDTFTSQDSVVMRQTGAIQDSYVLGVGDEIIVNLRGQDSDQYRRRVDRDGQIVLPRLAPISAAGRTFGAFRADLEAAIADAFIATEAYVSLGQIRQVSVLVAGEVHVPGVVTLTGLSTPLDALIISGGIKRTGSLREIRVMRAGRALAVDLYALLVGAAGEPGFHLQEGDRIVVPPLARTVGVVGAVRRPAIYELGGRRAISARDLVDLAGGVELRGAYRFVVMRTRADGVREFKEIDSRLGDTIQDGDILYVQPAVDETIGRVTLKGHTRLAGSYSLDRARSIRDLIGTPSALKDLPYLSFGVISRRDPDSFTNVLLPFSPSGAMRGTVQTPLRDHDIVWVFSVEEARQLAAEARAEELERLERQRELFVAEQRRAQNNFGQDAVSSRVGSDAAGRETDPLTDDAFGAGGAGLAIGAAGIASQFDDTDRRQRQRGSDPAGRDRFARQDEFGRPVERDRRFADDEFDRQRARTLDEFEDPRFRDRREMRRRGDEVFAPDGTLIEDREPLDIDTLAEGLGVDRRAVAVFLTEYIATIRGAVRVPGHYLIAPDTGLAELVSAAGGLKRTADRATVEITATTFDNLRGLSNTIRQNISLQETPLASIRVQPQDSVVIRDVYSDRWEGRVNVFGEVRFPGAYEIVRGEKLSSLLARAGGLSDLAFPYGAIFSRRAVARREQEINQRKSEDLQNLIIAQSSRREVNAEQIQFLQGLVAQLRDQTSIGRIAVEIDPNILMARPELDVELEPGDAIFIPSRPSTVTVTGQVLNGGSFQFDPGEKAGHYIDMAGGYNDLADDERVFVVYPDGTSERLRDGFWSLRSTRIVPGAVIVVPYDVTPFFFSDFIRDTVQVTSQLAITAASVAAVTN